MEQETAFPTAPPIIDAPATPQPKAKTTYDQRRAIARKAAKARWGGKKTSGRKYPPGKPSAVFGKALTAAENRLAAAIEERAYHINMTAALNAEIPSLTQTIRALTNIEKPQTPAMGILPAEQLASTLALNAQLPMAPAMGATLNVNLADDPEEDQFLKDANLPGGAWH